jgi:HK97 family phage major capsid protein
MGGKKQMSIDLKQVYSEMQTTWGEMKSMLERQEGEIKTVGAASQETKNTIEALNTRISELETKLNRVPINLEPQTRQGEPTQEEKAILAYMRKGKSGLTADETKSLSSNSDPEGGYIVSKEFRSKLITKLRDVVLIRRFATVLSTKAQSVSFPSFDYDGNAEWTPESKQIGEENFSNLLGKTSFIPHKLARIFRVPVELIEDTDFDLVEFLTNHFAIRYGEIEENAFINGDGVNKPFGLLNTPDVNIVKAGGTTLTDVTGDDLINQIYAVKSIYRGKAKWLAQREFVKHVRKLKTTDGAYIWQPGLQAGEPANILGYGLIESEFFPVPAADGVAAMFGDLSHYWIVDRTDLATQRLTEKYAEFDQIGVKLRKRTDAAPTIGEPFAKLTLEV